MEGSPHELAGSALPLGRAAPMTAKTVAVQSRQPIPNVSDFEKSGRAARVSYAGHNRLSKGQVHPRLTQPHLTRSCMAAPAGRSWPDHRTVGAGSGCPQDGLGSMFPGPDILAVLAESDALLWFSPVQSLEQIEKVIRNRLRPQLLMHGPKVLADVVLNVRADLSLSRVWLGPGSWRMS